MSMKEYLEFAKFDPAPKGTSQYPDNQGGFNLVAPATVGTVAQGSGAGVKFYPIHLQVEATKVQLAAFDKLVTTNDKKPTKLTLTSAHTVSGKREAIEVAVYGGLEFKNIMANFSQGEQKGVIFVDATYTTVEKQIKEFDENGKASPSAKVKIDLARGTYK
jgi:hypothetical protein